MTELIIHNKSGVQKAKCKSFEYHGTFLGERFLSLNISSPTPISWSIGDYAEYRGERFELNYDPTVIKQSTRGTYGDAFKYENVKLNSLSDELVRASFLDVVKDDNQIHFTSLDKFSFFAHSVNDLADRIKANLDRLYTGGNAWTVQVSDEGSERDKSISISGTNVWGALALVSSEFNLNFKVRGRTITIGSSGVNVGRTFGYGKGNGFVTLQKTADENQAVITRLYAYGNSKNLPSQYYKNKVDGLPNNYAVTNLMLPSFSTDNQHPYIESDRVSELGVREGVVYFDGSNGLEDIYPTIEGTSLNYVVSADEITDNGVFDTEGANIPNFHITIPDIGFDINDYLSSETATISFKTGMCAGREFKIVDCKFVDGNYVLELNRSQDSDLDLYFPYSGYNISANDKFVLLNIDMPDTYVVAAEQRLLTAAQDYLSKNDHVRYTYVPKIDNIFIQREYDSNTDKTQSIYYNITEGDTLDFADTDLDIEESIFIDTLIIKEGSAAIPEFEITLAEEKQPTLSDRIQNQIDTTVKQYVPKVDVDLSAYQTWVRTQALLGLTTIDGGLILSNTIILNDQDGNVSAGINGIVGESNIAAWYGGNMENAKTLFRFDGSGYVANGNLSWDSTGNVTLSNGAKISGSNVTIGKIAEWTELFEKVNIGTSSNPVYAIKAKYGLYTDSFLSGFGLGSTEGGGGGEGGSSVIVEDKLDSTSVTSALSANMGRYLKQLIDEKTFTLTSSAITNALGYTPVDPTALDSLYIGTTKVQKSSANQALSGITSILMHRTSTQYHAAIEINSNGSLYIQPREEGVSFNKNTIINLNGGNVGIGISSPSYKLDVDSATAVSSWLGHFGNGKVGTYLSHGDGNGLWVGTDKSDTTHYIASFKYGCADDGSGGLFALHLRADGNVGIGTNAPTEKLHINGAVRIGDAVLSWDSTNKALKVSTGLYSESFVSGFGASVSGGNSGASSIKYGSQTFISNDDGVIDISELNLTKTGRSKYLETLASNGTSWYGDTCKMYAQWTSDNVLNIKVDGYKTSVDRLTESRTIWGQPFNGTQNVTGNIYMPNNSAVTMKSTTDVYNNVLWLSGSNTLHLGHETADKGYATYINGADVVLRYGTARTEGIRLKSDGVTQFNGNLLLHKASTQYFTAIEIDSTGALYIQPREDGVSFNKNSLLNTRGGNVGIGTSSPSYKLDVDSSTAVSSWLGHFGNGKVGTYLSHGDGNGLWVGTDKSDTTHYIASFKYGCADDGSGGLFALHLRADGNVGIGTSSPSSKLHVVADNYAMLTLQRNDTTSVSGIAFSNNTKTCGRFGVSGNGYFLWDIGDSTNHLMVLTLDGKLGIGTTSPTQKLEVNGNAKATKFIGVLEGNADTATAVLDYGNTSKTIKIGYSGTGLSSCTYLAAYNSDGSAIKDIAPSKVEGVGSAIKLETARTIWGQSFNGTANVSGNMTGVGSISAKGDITSSFTDTTKVSISVSNSNGSVGIRASGNRGLVDVTNNAWIVGTNGTNTWLSQGNVGIGTDAPSAKLEVNGSVKIGGATLSWDSTNGCLKIDKGFVSNSFISAFGLGTANALTITPSANNTYDLGSNTYQWRYGYIGWIGAKSGNTFSMGANNGTHLSISTTGVISQQGSTASPTTSSTSAAVSLAGGMYIAKNLRVAGSVYYGSTPSTLSDMRYKNVIENRQIDLDKIANAPLFAFRYKSGGIAKIGTSAQYWRDIMGEFVEGDDTLSLDYSALGVALGISLAKHVESHEERIARLEKENEQLKNELKKYVA